MDGRNPIARTNVAPLVGPPPEPSLHAFSYTVAAQPAGQPTGPTFVAAGSGEAQGGQASRAGVVRPDETSPDAMREKAAYVMAVMQARLAGPGATWADVTAVDVYTVHPLEGFLATESSRRWVPRRPTAFTGTCPIRRSRAWPSRWICAGSGAKSACRSPNPMSPRTPPGRAGRERAPAPHTGRVQRATKPAGIGGRARRVNAGVMLRALLDASVRKAMAEARVPGVAVGVRVGAQEVAVGYGVTSVEDPLPVHARTLFQIGSVSKTFTAAAIMALAERGRLSSTTRCAGTCRRFGSPRRGTRNGSRSATC